jgi:prevent-host-death family protein
MRTLPISEIKGNLSEVMDAAHLTGDQVTVTKNGMNSRNDCLAFLGGNP